MTTTKNLRFRNMKNNKKCRFRNIAEHEKHRFRNTLTGTAETGPVSDRPRRQYERRVKEKIKAGLPRKIILRRSAFLTGKSPVIVVLL